MTHRRGAIWTERVLLGLILVSLVGTLNLLVAIHRRAAAERKEMVPAPPAVAKAADPVPTTESAPEPPPLESPAIAKQPVPSPAPPEEDPTQKAIASLAAAKAKEIEAAQAADNRASGMEGAYRSAVAESDRWKRREMLVRQQIAGINVQAEKLERDAVALDAERDVLEHERDATKAALAKASKRSGFAVLPYKGPNGTWRRPIVIECTHGGANLQPNGPKFTALELSPRINPKMSTFIRAIARELLRIHAADTPDGTPAVPYIVFLVRPDGVAPYYLARTCLEPLGIAFGYELVEQNLAINIPDFDDLTTWDGTVPLDLPLEPAPASEPISRRLAQANQTNDQNRTALAGLPPGDQDSMIGAIDRDGGGRRGAEGQGLSSSGSSQPQDFVWPGRGPRADQAGRRSAGAPGAGEPGSQLGQGDLAQSSTDRRAGGNEPNGSARALGPLSGQDLASADQGAPDGRAGKYDTTKAGRAGAGGLSGLAVASSAGRGSGDQPDGGGGLAAGSTKSRGLGDQAGSSGSGVAAGAINAEDVGTGAGVNPADQPFPPSGAGMGGLGTGGSGPGAGGAGLGSGGSGLAPGHSFAAGGNEPGGGSGSADGMPQVPAFEPAGEPAGGSASGDQPGLLSGRGSKGGTSAGAQAPAFGLGQNINGSFPRADNGSAGRDGALPQSGGAMAAGGDPSGLIAPNSGVGPGGNSAGVDDSSSGTGSGAKSTAGDPASGDGRNPKSTGTGAGGTGPGQAPGRGFDWKDAAQDGPPPAGSETPQSVQALGQDPSGADTGPQTTAAAARANVAAGGALNRTSLPPNGQLDPALRAYQGVQYSQDDIERAKSLSSQYSQDDIERAKSLSSQFSQDDIERAKSLSGLSSFVSPGLAQKLASAAAAFGSPSGLPSSSSSNDPPPDLQSGGMPSSTSSSDNSSNNQSGGMPLGGNTQSSMSSSSSSMNSLGLNASPSSSPSSDDANDLIMPPRKKETMPTGAIEAKFEIVVVCRKDDLVLQPGGYRLTGAVLRSASQGSDFILAREIRAMVRNRAMVDPLIHQKPALRFLVEQQGAETFALARRQLLFSLPDWPVALQVAGSQDSGIFSRNPW